MRPVVARLALTLLAAAACGSRCGGDEVATAEDPVAATRQRYFEDASYRRAVLESALTNHANTYSRDRLARYGHADQAWEALPVWNPRAVPLTDAHVDALRRDEPLELGEPAPLWDGVVPASEEEWRELGERVFFEWPLRGDEFIEHALRDEGFARANGLHRGYAGDRPGLVAFRDVDGRTRVGFTCALCHASVDAEAGIATAGAARRDLDYGAIRIAYYQATGAPLDRELGDRMRRWGPGRADITGDDDEDPVAIPDLWQLHRLENLTQAGTIRLDPIDAPERAEGRSDLVALAIRQETQIIQANRERIRPPRELAWALAMYVAELEPPRPIAELAPSPSPRGRVLFEEHCIGCHFGPTGSGPLVAAARVGTDRALADSHARGTGRFRPAPLVAVRGAAPYFHDGSVPTLADVLDPARLRSDYARGVRGPGPVEGHAFGTRLPPQDRAALVRYLETL
ncbi:MAG TPA: c-type cytochrome [Nannocystaceae bacterium]|nr:c-type cytochrome [Nannocystaceae bacterium]